MKKLNDKQEAFCREYVVDLNSAQAAIRAGYSEKTARTIGSKLLTNIDISEKIQSLSDKHAANVGITTEWVLNGIKELTERLVKMDDPKAAYKGYELGGKYLTLFSDKIDHTSSDGTMTPTTFTFVPVGVDD
jgi:phage terminase small subunit